MGKEGPFEVGEVVAGKYRIERVLGAGGMGVVVAATDQTLDRLVAIKFLLPDWAAQPIAAQRFTREARAAAKIQSEHVARVIDVSTLENGSPYMVMEHLEGGDLAQELRSKGQLPIEDAVMYVLEACEAIAEAHVAGIVHRDLKPANLFLAERADGTRTVKVLDFGISKSTGATEPALTKTGGMMGSPLYMSPEQMRSSKDVDHRTDIWSLGAILHELLTASPPFNADSMSGLVAAVLEKKPAPIREARPDVPVELENVLDDALNKDREHRHQNVSELAQALAPFGPAAARVSLERIQRVLERGGLLATPSARVEPESSASASTNASWGGTAPGELSRKKRPRTTMWAVAGVGGVAVVAILFVAFGGGSSDVTESVGSSSAVTAETLDAPAQDPREHAPAEEVAPVVSAAGTLPDAAADPTSPVRSGKDGPSGERKPTSPKPAAPKPVAGKPIVRKPPAPAPAPEPAPASTSTRKWGGRK